MYVHVSSADSVELTVIRMKPDSKEISTCFASFNLWKPDCSISMSNITIKYVKVPVEMQNVENNYVVVCLRLAPPYQHVYLSI
jgi:hypothetical protein